MKRLKLLFIGIFVLGMLLSTAMVLANPITVDEGLKPPEKTITPGAKATEKAMERPPEQPGKKNEPSKAPEKVPPAKGPKDVKGAVQVYQGTVDSVGSQSLALKLVSNEIVTFTISTTVKISVPGIKRATLSDVEVGARAMVQARKAADGSRIAMSINVFLPKPAKQQRVGYVTEYIPGVSITIVGKAGLPSPRSITTTRGITATYGITLTNGLTTTFGVTPTYGITTTYAITTSTVILPAERASQLAVGVRVTIIAPSAASQGGRLVAQGIIIHPATNTEMEEEEPTK